MRPSSSHPWPFCGSHSPVAATAMLVLFLVLAFPAAAHGPSPPPIPAHPDRFDDLAVTPREWTEVGRGEGPVIDLHGVQPPGAHPLGVEVAYRLLGQRAAVEGSLAIPDRPDGTLLRVSNTGVQFDWITFAPPLVLADGSLLEHILPRFLEWTGSDLGSDSPGYAFHANVPAPDDGGWSPPDGPGDEGPTGITLAWLLQLVNASQEDRAGLPISPANAHLRYAIQIPEEAIDPAARDRLTETNVTLSFRFDYARPAPGSAHAGPAPLDTDGIYLIQGQAVATLRFVGVSEEPAATRTFSGPPGHATPQQETRTLTPSLVANTTVPLTFLSLSNETTHGASARLELGYLYQFPPPATATPTASPPPDENDTPAPAFVLGIGIALTLASLARRHGRPS